MTHTPKTYDKKILNYLKTPNNLPMALQIGDYAAKIREDMPKDFWSAVVTRLNATRPSSLPPGEFTFKPPTKAYLEQSMFGLQRVNPSAKSGHSLYCAIEVNNNEEEFYVYMGIGWSSQPEKKNSPTYKLPEVEALRNAMETEEEGYEFSAPWWLCGRYSWPPSAKDKFLVGIAESGNKILETSVVSYWRMVKRYWPQVEKVNKALLKQKGKR